MSARSNMTMRATVERRGDGGLDEYNQPADSDFAEVTTGEPIRAWSKVRREAIDVGKTAIVEDMRAMVPLTTQIVEGDQLTIVDRQGVEQFGGPVLVEVKQRRGSSRSHASYYLLLLRRHK